MDLYSLRVDRNELVCIITGLQHVIEESTGNPMAVDREMFARAAMDKAEALLKVVEAEAVVAQARRDYLNIVEHGKDYSEEPFA